MKPELYLTDALGATGKPMFRVHTAGSVGGTTGIVASHLVESGRHTARARGRAARSSPRATRSSRSARGKGASHRRGRRVRAVHARRTSHAPGAPLDIGPMVAVKDRLNALKNPYAHLQARRHLDREGQGVADDVGPGALPRVVPVVRRRVRGGVHRRGRRRGGREGRTARRRGSSARRCAPSRRRSRAAIRCVRRARSTARPTCTRRPASPTRASRSTAPSSTCRSAGTSRCGSRRHDIAEPGEGWKMVERGDTALDGSFPVNMSGGVLSSNPIGASGLLRFAEAALQVRGHGRRAPGRRREGRARPGLRRVGAVLLDVGRRQLARPVRQLIDRSCGARAYGASLAMMSSRSPYFLRSRRTTCARALARSS